MKRNCIKHIQYVAATVACLSMSMPSVALSKSPDLAVADVALSEGGLLVGQVVDGHGQAQAGQTVSILYGDEEVVRTTTDKNGIFAARGLRGGQYRLTSEQGGAMVRAWAPETAPPSAGNAALMVVGDEVVVGQIGGFPSNVMNWMRNHPWLTATGVAAAIAIPVAIAASDDDDGGS